MAIFIGHRTALAYWRTHDRNWAQPISRAAPQENNSPYYAQMDTGILWKFGIDEKPVSILVSCKANMRKSQNLSPRIWSGKHPSRSFYKIAQDLYISTPEATFLQLGKELSLIQLITIGYELCGSYGLSVQSSSGFLRREPRSNPQLIERYLEKCEGIHGVKAAKRASPELNYPIETNEGSVAIRRCDLCWPDQQFALEYDSDTFHSDASKLHLDSSRRSALEKAGVHVVSVTKNQVFDRGQLFNLATIASKRLGKRLSPTPFNFAQKQDEIYQAVFE